MESWPRLMLRALWGAVVAAAPLHIVWILTNDAAAFVGFGVIPSLVLFFIVLLVQMHRAQMADAVGSVIVVLSVFAHLVPLVGPLIAGAGDSLRTAKSGPKSRKPTQAEQRRMRLAIWLGVLLAGVPAAIAPWLVSGNIRATEKIGLSMACGIAGATLGCIIAVALAESIASSAARRLIVVDLLFGMLYGALASVSTTTPDISVILLFMAVASAVGLIAGTYGVVNRRGEFAATSV